MASGCIPELMAFSVFYNTSPFNQFPRPDLIWHLHLHLRFTAKCVKNEDLITLFLTFTLSLNSLLDYLRMNLPQFEHYSKQSNSQRQTPFFTFPVFTKTGQVPVVTLSQV
jgi:hypothetical protein